MVSEQVWHALAVEEVEDLLDAPAAGLTAGEASTRWEQAGPNVIPTVPPPSVMATVVDQFRSPLIAILLVATAITLALGDHLDAIVIGAVLVLNAAIGTVQERRAEQSVRALQRLVASRARVLRDGHEEEVDSAALVPGDVVLLTPGARVPADVRVAEATTLSVDESLLTGESATVTKHARPIPADTGLADRANMAYAGSVVTRGRGRGYVVATGTATELGAIADEVQATTSPRTPVQVRLDTLARRIGVLVLGAAGLAFVAGVVAGHRVAEMFAFAVALAVSAVPEGLPVAFTITMAVGVTRMARRHAIVRHLAAVETLGSTTVVCADKTGTITRNEVTVTEIRTATDRFVVHGAREHDDVLGTEDVAEQREVWLMLLTGVVASEADAFQVDGRLRTSGDPTEAALVRVAAEVGLDPWRLRSEHPVVRRVPFEPERRYAAVQVRHDGHETILVQGAPERVLALCDREMRHGRTRPLDRDRAVRAVEELAAHGRRVLAFAWRPLHDGAHADDELDGDVPPSGLVLLGLQGMVDPPRDGVADAVASCRLAGMRVVMVTGDHGVTATAIAEAVGLGEGATVTGADLDAMDDDTLRARLPGTTVFARVAPEQKLRIVTALRALGEVVAVTGDGVNDAPALQAADIGVAMGRDGTDVAREAADMVLADDDFVTIRAAVEEGRVTFDNLRKVTFFLISTGAAEIVMLLSGLVLGWPLVLLPAQLLWLNLVTNGLQDVALAFEPADPGVLRRPPREPREGLVSRRLWVRTAMVAAVMGVGSLLMFGWSWRQTGSLETARTTAMTTMVLFQAVHVGNCRRERRSAFATPPWSNRFLLGSVAAALVVHAGALHLPATQWLLQASPLPLRTWVVAAFVSLSVLVVVELHKLVDVRPDGHVTTGDETAPGPAAGGRRRPRRPGSARTPG